MHDLLDASVRYGFERGAEVGVSIDDFPPGLSEFLDIESAPDLIALLHVIEASAEMRKRMEIHALLHRRQRINILDVAMLAANAGDFLLIEVRQCEIRRERLQSARGLCRLGVRIAETRQNGRQLRGAGRSNS